MKGGKDDPKTLSPGSGDICELEAHVPTSKEQGTTQSLWMRHICIYGHAHVLMHGHMYMRVCVCVCERGAVEDEGFRPVDVAVRSTGAGAVKAQRTMSGSKQVTAVQPQR